MKNIFTRSGEALNELIDVLVQLPSQAGYAQPCAALSNASIGQHTRHIIELYQCLLTGYETGMVDYDSRKRNKLYENDKELAVIIIKEIQNQLDQPDKPLSIRDHEDSLSISSNYLREVLYNLEHCIHHQALIKVALLSMKEVTISAEFGVAASTLQYRRECAQ